MFTTVYLKGHEIVKLVEARRYKVKVAGSVLDGIINIILPAALGSTQSLTEMSTRSISWR